MSADLVSLVEEQAEVGENNPEFLPAVTVLELPQEVTWELVLHRWKEQQTERLDSDNEMTGTDISSQALNNTLVAVCERLVVTYCTDYTEDVCVLTRAD